MKKCVRENGQKQHYDVMTLKNTEIPLKYGRKIVVRFTGFYEFSVKSWRHCHKCLQTRISKKLALCKNKFNYIY